MCIVVCGHARCENNPGRFSVSAVQRGFFHLTGHTHQCSAWHGYHRAGSRLRWNWPLKSWRRHGPVSSLSCSQKMGMSIFEIRVHLHIGCAKGDNSSDGELDVEYQRKEPRGCCTVQRVCMSDLNELKSSAWRPRLVRRFHGTAAWFTAAT